MRTLTNQYTPVIRPNMIPHSRVNVTSGDGDYLVYDFGVLPDAIVPGETYTLTVHGAANDAQGRQWIEVDIWENGWGADTVNRVTLYHDQTVKSMTFTASEGWAGKEAHVSAYYVPSQHGGHTYGNCTIDWVKLEHGAEATPWCPYPLDDYDLLTRIKALETAAGLAHDPGPVEGPEMFAAAGGVIWLPDLLTSERRWAA